MDRAQFATRKADLIRQCENEGIDWKTLTSGIPQDDDGLVSAALGTRLGYNLKDVFAGSKTIADLEARRTSISDDRRRLKELADKVG
jgi:hypothetical protein